MKIIEFDGDGEVTQRARETRPEALRLVEREIKIIEFDGGERASAPAVTPPRVGSIKIVEFDEEPGRDASAAAPEPRRPSPKHVKIVDFDAEATEKARPLTRRDGMKIIEFD